MIRLRALTAPLLTATSSLRPVSALWAASDYDEF